MNQSGSLLTFILSYVPDPLVSTFLGRQPNEHESVVISKLRALLNTPYDGCEHEDYLRRIFAASGVEGTYSSTGQHWKRIGFQQPNPASDIRGGGLLSLQCITYFLEKRPNVALVMLTRRYRTYGEGGSYPWATAGIVLTRLLAAVFGVIHANGASVKQQEKQLYWHLLRSEEDFYRLFCCMFVLLDNIWQQEQATYMEFPRIQVMMEQQFRSILARVPQNITVIEELLNPELVEHLNYTSLPEAQFSAAGHEMQEPTSIKTDVPTTDDLLFIDYDYNYEDQMVEALAPSTSSSGFWLDRWHDDDQLISLNSDSSLRYRNPVMVV